MGATRLYDIERFCKRRPGAIRDLGLIAPEDVDTLVPLTLKSGKRMYLYQQDRFSGRLAKKTDDANRAGDVIDYSLSAFVKGVRMDVDLLAQALLNRRIHVLVTYWAGEQQLVQNIRLLHGHDSGEKLSSKMGYALTGKARAHKGTPLLNAPLNIPTICTGYEEPPTPGDEAMTVEINTSNPTYTYTVPAGRWLENIFLKSDSDQVVSLGRTSGAGDIADSYPMSAGLSALLTGTLLFAETDTPIHFSGLAGTNNIKILLLG